MGARCRDERDDGGRFGAAGPEDRGDSAAGLPIDRYVVGQAKPPDIAGQQLLDLTLEQAMQTALDKNLELQVARVNPQIQDYNLASARAAFIPTLTASFNQNRSSSVTTSALDNVSTNLTNQSQAYEALAAKIAVVKARDKAAGTRRRIIRTSD